jgi:hypothetical protein
MLPIPVHPFGKPPAFGLGERGSLDTSLHPDFEKETPHAYLRTVLFVTGSRMTLTAMLSTSTKKSQNHAIHTEASRRSSPMVAVPLGPGDGHRC